MYPLFGQIKTNRGAFRGSPLKLTAGTNARELLRRFVEALDDFVGEVNLGARPDMFLKNQVVLLALGEILNDADGARENNLAFFLSALVALFKKRALHAGDFAFFFGEVTALA